MSSLLCRLVCVLSATLFVTSTTFAGSPNFLIITADDMNWDSPGCYGCPIAGTTPNIDMLAASGMRFEHAHVAATACYPSRSAISTGRIGHRSGGEGFFFLRFPDVPTVQQLLHDNNYRVGILGKVDHSTPYEDTPWDVATEMHRNTDEFARDAAAFIDQSLQEEKPFYLIVNSHDPHRPYFNPDSRKNQPGDLPSKIYKPAEIPIHPTLPDHPDVREEQANYFSSVRRCDDVVGRMVKLVEDRQLGRDTMIIFLSDHGMAVPSAKSNLYVQSSRTPFVIRWDAKVKHNQTDSDHMISTLDILPTILEAAEIENPGGMDGRTLMPLLSGKTQSGRDHIFTQSYMRIGKTSYQMRALQTKEHLLLFNPWHNGKPVYATSALGGNCFKAMLQLGKHDPHWAARTQFILTRTPMEFFTLADDPYCLKNLIDDPDWQDRIAEFKSKLFQHLSRTNDPMSEVFEVYEQTKSVPRMVETYVAMWDKYDMPGRVAANPVNLSRWSDTDQPMSTKKKMEKATPSKTEETESAKPSKKLTDEERAAIRKARRAQQKQQEAGK